MIQNNLVSIIVPIENLDNFHHLPVLSHGQLPNITSNIKPTHDISQQTVSKRQLKKT
ncbi:MAG: hypothetical protein LBP59_17310 [Planctomycetaceae bacterium]|nr:hypothetical protein [Planctomycetaceae bacterium]